MDNPVDRPLSPAAKGARLYLWPLVLLGLALRLAVVWVTARGHSAAWFFGQATELGKLAESLRTGHGLSSPFGGSTGPSAFLSPGYPAIVAAIFAIFHPYSLASVAALMTLQALFGAATVWVLMLMTRRAFGVSAANLAGAIWAVSPPLLWLPTLFWETSLSILLATAIVALSLYWIDKPTWRAWALAGITAALVLSINPSLLTILAGCGGWAIYSIRPRSLSGPALALVVCVSLSAPWVIRNFHEFHAFIPLRSNMGYELWQGNRPGSNGAFSDSLHPNVNADEFSRYQSLGEVGYMHEKSTIAKNAIKSDPLRFIELTAKRAVYFWTGMVRHASFLIVGYIVLTTVLGLAGLWMLWRRNSSCAALFSLPLLFMPLPYYITHSDFRFRLVLDPILTALTAYLLTSRTPNADRPNAHAASSN